MAETVNSMSEADERRELEAMVPPLTRPKTHNVVYGGRFTVAYLILVLVFGGVASLFTYLVVRADAQPWSSWRPDGSGIARATQIANRVSPNYRADGEQLTVVEAQPPVIQGSPIDVVAVARDRIQAVGGGFITVEPANRTIFYVFCGLGQACSLSDPAQGVGLLRRQSLELALYTFKYMDNVDSVVALLPPRGQETRAVYLRRRALAKELEQPLRSTLPGKAPYTPTSLTDLARVEKLTVHREFPAYFQRVSNGGIMLRLGGPAPTEAEQGQQGGGAQTP
jgi:hypothetical protein